jgi:DNA-binding IclR family transcriptional regulator
MGVACRSNDFVVAADAMSNVVKSAARVLEVFEYFDSVRADATVMDIARALDYPQSSTSALIRSLVDLGYLQHGTKYRTYRPTPRVTLLGTWIEPMLSPDGAIVRLMDELGEATGETIILGAAYSTIVRYIYVVPATTAMRLHVGPGTSRPIVNSGTGRMFMASMNDERVRWLVHRHNTEATTSASKLSLAAVRRDLAAIRADGYSVSFDKATPGAGIVAAGLPVAPGRAPLVVGIGGLSQTIRANAEDFGRLIRRAIKRHFGPSIKAHDDGRGDRPNAN